MLPLHDFFNDSIMKIFKTIAQLQQQLDADRAAGKTIGLVPTMGALHNGHLQLVKTSVAHNDVTVVSIFVNPTQFNDKNDLLLYPRTLDQDCRLLESVNCFRPIGRRDLPYRRHSGIQFR